MLADRNSMMTVLNQADETESRIHLTPKLVAGRMAVFKRIVFFTNLLTDVTQFSRTATFMLPYLAR